MSNIEARILDNLNPSTHLGAQWEALVKSNPANGFMQSLHWAECKRHQGLAVFHVGIFQEECLIAGAIFYTAMKCNGAGILVAPEGPVLPWENESLALEALRLIIDICQSGAAELGIMAMRIEPRVAPPPLPLLREFGRAPVNLVPRETLYIDISLPAEVCLAQMKPKGRYNIALASRHGVEVGEDTSDDRVKTFYSVIKEASQRDDFALEPLSFFEHLELALCPSGCAKFLLAKHEGEILGALLLTTYGSRGTYLYGGITNRKRNLMAGYALQWAAMMKSKEEGCTTYDFYGIDQFRVPDHPYSRFSQFKTQFGGRVVTFIGAHDYFFLDNLADAFIKVINQAKEQTFAQSEAIEDSAGTACLV
jgi:peptidoglycan pentaglycine glycine transferase (the first glycine)